MLQVTCDVIGIAQIILFEIQDGSHVLCIMSKLKAFLVNSHFKMLETELKRF